MLSSSWRTFLSATLLLFVVREARAAEGTSLEEQKTEAVSGARVKIGAFMLAHVRRETSLDKEPGTLAPGVALGVGWRLADWEIEATARGAHYDEPTLFSLRRTTMLSVGGRARWFAFASSSVSPYLELGLDVIAFAVDSAHGIGPSAHAGAGIELLHDRAHHRLRIGLGADVPAFAVAYPQASFACETCMPFSTDRPLYLVPATLAATWTF